jgi:hypothetical protein
MTGPLILITLGVLLLLQNLYPQTFGFSRVWPVVLIVIGLSKVLGSLAGRSKGKPDTGGESQ